MPGNLFVVLWIEAKALSIMSRGSTLSPRFNSQHCKKGQIKNLTYLLVSGVFSGPLHTQLRKLDLKYIKLNYV